MLILVKEAGLDTVHACTGIGQETWIILMCRYLIDLRLRPPGTHAHQYVYEQMKGLDHCDELVMRVDENPRFLLCRLQAMLESSLFCHIERHREFLWHLTLSRSPAAKFSEARLAVRASRGRRVRQGTALSAQRLNPAGGSVQTPPDPG